MVNLPVNSAAQAGRMTENPTPETDTLDQRRQARAALKNRHAKNLIRLMDERDDLRGVHALADFVDEAVRWTA